MSKYYLYRHVRHDNGEIFYVGIGTFNERGKTIQTKYKRAHETSWAHRPNHEWQKIYKISNYDIEIIFHTESHELILQKEKEFVKLYGRKDLNKGTLTNVSDGGSGCTGFKMSQETKRKIKEKSLFLSL